MNKSTKILTLVVLVIIVAGLVYASMRTDTEKMMDTTDQMMKDEAMMPSSEADMKEEGAEKSMMMEEDMMKSGSYEAYAPEKLARAETGDVVLFFHASWCPSCRGLNADINNNLKSIPPEVSILKVDYDKSADMKKKYGVTYQHTLVQVDANGTLIKKWSGSPTLSDIVSKIE